MQGSIRSLFAGAVSGLGAYLASLFAMGYTNALAMPAWAPLKVWEVMVVFGLGATLVALVIHLAALWILRGRPSLALASFFGTTLLTMAVAGLLGSGAETLVAWLVGAFLASLAYGRLRRGAASSVGPRWNPA